MGYLAIPGSIVLAQSPERNHLMAELRVRWVLVALLLAGLPGIGCATRSLVPARMATPQEASAARAAEQCEVKVLDETTVRQLVGMLTEDDQVLVQFAFDQLIAAAPVIQPILIRHLDDRRRIAVRPLLVLNAMPHFEPFAQYGPDEVVDVLAIILGDPPAAGNSQDCSALANGGTEARRASCVRAWRQASAPAPSTRN
jgi:hypothetical protein